MPGSAPLIAEALRSAGMDPDRVVRLVLTHSHADHAGAAADIADRGGVEVVAHRLDAPVIRGAVPEPPSGPDRLGAPHPRGPAADPARTAVSGGPRGRRRRRPRIRRRRPRAVDPRPHRQ
ncbi:MBL fold metallo-hydrolase [Spinactinospora alkalitolerans]|uniref:MBL fold metallo-hydrolase n=1 Tax=Spinactinospora alkalitolerans TaxID=687207 RepID=UPI0031DB0EC1